jgi:hypothetical protein
MTYGAGMGVGCSGITTGIMGIYFARKMEILIFKDILKKMILTVFVFFLDFLI